eukprot:jgi/Chlat1/3340/Chrsp23S03775
MWAVSMATAAMAGVAVGPGLAPPPAGLLRRRERRQPGRRRPAVVSSSAQDNNGPQQQQHDAAVGGNGVGGNGRTISLMQKILSDEIPFLPKPEPDSHFRPHGLAAPAGSAPDRKGTDWRKLWPRFVEVAAPYWQSEDKASLSASYLHTILLSNKTYVIDTHNSRVRIQTLAVDHAAAYARLAGVFGLTLATTGISVGFNFLGRDFYNALSSKNADLFTKELTLYLGAFIVGIPVFVVRDFYKDKLAVRWRAWMTSHILGKYFAQRRFYSVQRIVDDIASFTGTSLGFSLALFNAGIDLASFSSILYSIYPPLFVALILYAVGGTGISVFLGKGLVSLNFVQEKREADFRYSLVRVRENAEAIAFYGGEASETHVLLQRFRRSFDNYLRLLVASRNLDFFTTGYRYLIQLLPAAVVAPLYFRGEIEFGVINQSFSAFNHILSDFSLVVYQFQALSAFSAVVDRLGEFVDVLETDESAAGNNGTHTLINLEEMAESTSAHDPLLSINSLKLCTPNGGSTLVQDLSLDVAQGSPVLVMGPSGSGKTSLLRAIAGLWRVGEGSIIRRVVDPTVKHADNSSLVFFVPQRPYMILGSLREQMLYPTWTGSSEGKLDSRPVPTDEELVEALETVRLTGGLDALTEWSSVLSLGEQQRLAFARLLLAKPRLALLDESTSALDSENEEHLYKLLASSGITYVSVGHRTSLRRYHHRMLQLQGPTRDGGWQVEDLQGVGEGDNENGAAIVENKAAAVPT